MHSWAGTYHDLNIQLGYLAEGREPYLVPTPGSDQDDRIILWIHNDNDQDIAERNGSDSQGVINHYSGLKRPSTGTQKKIAGFRKRSRKQLSDTDSESSGDDEIAKRRAKIDDDVQSFQTGRGTNRTVTRYTLAAYVDHIDVASIADPQTYAEAMRAPDAEEWQTAMRAAPGAPTGSGPRPG